MKKIFVGNISFSTTDTDLRRWLEPYGAVESATVVTDCNTSQSRGLGSRGGRGGGRDDYR